MSVVRINATRVLVTPSLLTRILYGRTARIADLTDIGWFYTPGGWVGRDVEAAIEKAV